MYIKRGIQSNDLIQEMRKEYFYIKSKHNHELDSQYDSQINELKKEVQQLQKENFEIKSKLKYLP